MGEASGPGEAGEQLNLCSSAEEATEEEKSLSRKIMKYWANFARSG